MSTNMTAVFIDECPKCNHKQEALVGYLSRCQECGYNWRSFRQIGRQSIIRFHSWIDEDGEYNDFSPSQT